MKTRIAVLLCAVMLALGALSPPAFASQSKTHYPVSVEEYTEDGTDAHRIKKVYQLSLTDDPEGISTKPFERDGIQYELLDLTMMNEAGVDTKGYSETITQDSSTGDMAAILKQLDAQRKVTTEDGYTGVLLLDHTTVNVKAKGYSTSTKNLTASRTYPNLSDADLSLVPKTVTEGGKTLTLGNVQWSNSYDEGGAAHYTASATYTGTATSRYATGYKCGVAGRKGGDNGPGVSADDQELVAALRLPGLRIGGVLLDADIRHFHVIRQLTDAERDLLRCGGHRHSHGKGLHIAHLGVGIHLQLEGLGSRYRGRTLQQFAAPRPRTT